MQRPHAKRNLDYGFHGDRLAVLGARPEVPVRERTDGILIEPLIKAVEHANAVDRAVRLNDRIERHSAFDVITQHISRIRGIHLG